MPHARLDIDSDWIPAQNVYFCDLARIVKREECQFTAKHQERLRFRRIAMAMRSDVGSFQHHVQKAMRIVVHADVEVMICAQT